MQFDEPADPRDDRAVPRALHELLRITPDELRAAASRLSASRRPARTLSPCNRHHVELASRAWRDGIRDAGGVPLEFPIHPIQETRQAADRLRHSTASLAYLSLVEILHGYPIDGVVLTTGAATRPRRPV